MNQRGSSCPLFSLTEDGKAKAMEHVHINLGILALICGIISAKWAMELRFSQLGQILWGIAGLLLGPLTLLILYIRQLGALQASGKPGGGWWHSSSAPARRHESPVAVDQSL